MIKIRNLTRTSLLLIAVSYIMAWSVGFQWRENIIEYDVSRYYAYLPAILNHQDLTFSFLDELPEEMLSDIDIRKNKTPDGNHYFNKMTVGLAWMYLPYYGLASLSSAIVASDKDPFSNFYGAFILFGGMIYGLVGLYLVSKILRNHFQDSVTALVLICIAFASNFFNYTVAEGGMSHVYSFFLFSLLLFLSIRYFQNPRWKIAFFSGIVFGLIVLIRPTNSIVIIPVFLWGVYGKSAFSERFDLLRKKLPHLIPFIMAMLIIIAPQLYYWKTMTGSWIYYSYQNEGFDFLQPEILNGLLSYRKGWLVYSPVMLFSIAGLFLLFNRKYRSFLLPVLSFFIINLYIVFSWETWWYGGGFGARALVESYVFLAFPMAVFINFVLNKSRTVRIFLLFVTAFLILLNLFQTYQYAKGILHRDSMTKKAYWHIFAKPNADVPERMFSPPSKK